MKVHGFNIHTRSDHYAAQQCMGVVTPFTRIRNPPSAYFSCKSCRSVDWHP